MVFVRFESSSPTIFKCKRDWVRCFLSGGEPSELNALIFELRYISLRRPFADSSARKIPSLHMLPQRGCREVVSRELIEDSTRKLVIVKSPNEKTYDDGSFAGLTGQQIGVNLSVHARAAAGYSWKASPADIALRSVSTSQASGLWEMG